MKTHTGRIAGLVVDEQGRQAAQVTCPAGAVPAPGQAVAACALEDDSLAALATPLFYGGAAEQGFLALPLESKLPATWLPGTPLQLRGPLGRGFRLPGNLRRLALAALGDTAGRLLPLAQRGLASGADVALFADQAPAALPARVELQPLDALIEALDWADFLAIDLPRQALPSLRRVLGRDAETKTLRLSCPVQALIITELPCAGLAACGACALPGRGGWRLTCEDGPVFDLSSLDW